MRKRLVAAIVFFSFLFLLVSPTFAQIIFSDDFNRSDGDPGSDWSIISGSWAIESGELSGHSSTVENIIVAGDTAWTCPIMEFKIYIVELEASIFVRADSNAQNGYLIHFYTGLNDLIYKRVDGAYVQVATGKLSKPVAGQWYNIRVEIIGGNIKVYRDGELDIDYTDAAPFTSGRIGVRVFRGRHGHFDDVIVDDPNGEPPVSTPEFEIGTPLAVSIATIIYMLTRRRYGNRKNRFF